MSEQSKQNEMASPNTSGLAGVLESLDTLEQEVVASSEHIERERRKANVVMKIVLVVLGCMALLNVHFMHVLTQEFRIMIKDMVAMYEHFGRVSERMNDMKVYVVDMEQNMKLMPVIDRQMSAMNDDISSMRTNMTSMAGDVQGMEQRIGTINHDVGVMSQRFRSMNSNVGSMQRNVGEMSDVVP